VIIELPPLSDVANFAKEIPMILGKKLKRIGQRHSMILKQFSLLG
jgi:hypothetical protein